MSLPSPEADDDTVKLGDEMDGGEGTMSQYCEVESVQPGRRVCELCASIVDDEEGASNVDDEEGSEMSEKDLLSAMVGGAMGGS